jgi:hypothetical protein
MQATAPEFASVLVVRCLSDNRRYALQKDASKGSFRGKLKRAGWDDAYLSSLLALF